jgi:hypothetical protein
LFGFIDATSNCGRENSGCAATLLTAIANINVLPIALMLRSSYWTKCDSEVRVVGSEKHSQALSLIAEKSDEEAVKVT